MKRPLVVTAMFLGAACLPGAITHYHADMIPVATCEVYRGEQFCIAPDGGTRIAGSMSVDDRGEDTRVYFRQETLQGRSDGDDLEVSNTRSLLRDNNGCITRQTFQINAVMDDPGFGLRKEMRGRAEELTVIEGDRQACGLNIPYGEIRRYDLRAVETTQP